MSNSNAGAAASGGAIYGLGIFGAWVYFWQQADCYQAALESVWDEPWFAGIYWWDWSAAPSVGGPQDTGFTPFGKPAEQVLRSWY